MSGISGYGKRTGPGRVRAAFSLVRAAALSTPEIVEDLPVTHPCPNDPACPYCNGTIAPESRLDWSFLDAVYCISLKTRDDRAALVAEQFHTSGLCQKVIFYRPTRHPKKGIIGSWESHRAVCADAAQRGCETTLICEDDVLFVRKLTPDSVRRIGIAIRELPANWSIFYLGHWPVWSYFIKTNVLRTMSACAHAYVASPRLLDWMKHHPYGAPGIAFYRPVGRALDSAFSQLPGTYALFPMIAIQSISKSDNFNYKPKPKTKLKHYITRSRYREFMLSNLMRPAEAIIVAMSPITWVTQTYKDWKARRAQSV